MPAAIDRYIVICLGPADQSDSKVYSGTFDEQIIIPANGTIDPGNHHWKNILSKYWRSCLKVVIKVVHLM